MSKKIDLFDKRILLLYVLNSTSSALTQGKIASYLSDFEDLTYFDICTYLEELIANEYVESFKENDELCYKITEKGCTILNELLSFIPGTDLYKLNKMINDNISSLSDGYSIGTTVIPASLEDEYKVSCYIKEGQDELINICFYAGTKEHAKHIFVNWENNCKDIYKHLLKIMTMPHPENYLSSQNVAANNNYKIGTNISVARGNDYKVVCFIHDGDEELINISLYAGSKEHAINISLNFQEYYKNIYSDIINMITN